MRAPDAVAAPTALGWDAPALHRGAILSAFVLALGIGATAALAPGLAIAAFALPAILGALVLVPEVVLLLFLTAGLYKEDPRIQALVPVDLTVALGALLCLALLVRALRRPVVLPGAVWLLVPMLLGLGLGLVRPASAYGAEKALRFCTLTMLAMLAALLLLDNRTSLRRFLMGLGWLGFVASLDAMRTGEAAAYSRLTFSGSSPIALGRVGAFAFAFGWLGFHFAHGAFDRVAAIGMVAVTAVCVLATGSRGPVLAVVGSLLVVSGYCALLHRRSPVALRPLLVGGALGLVAATLWAPTALPLYRFQLLFSEDKGTSVLVRALLFAIAGRQMVSHPLGIGVGGFERHAVLDHKYPHNLFLEVGCELGWLPLLGLLVFVAWTLVTAARVLRREYALPSLFLAVILLTALANAMVSGDLNDNRLLFTVILLPYVYDRIQSRERASGDPPPSQPT